MYKLPNSSGIMYDKGNPEPQMYAQQVMKGIGDDTYPVQLERETTLRVQLMA